MQGLSEKAFELANAKGMLNYKEIYYTKMEDMCYNYGWTPKEFREQEPGIISVFSAILDGRKKYGRTNMKL